MMTALQRSTLVLCTGWCVLVLVLFHTTLFDMVELWSGGQTFSHGFLILPISLWLLWSDRWRLAATPPSSEPRALVLTLGAGLTWLVAYLVDVNVVQQLAMVAILVSGVWALVGTPLARAMAFPLAFLFLAVPMGAGLIPPLMELTADTTEYLVRASGVPVFREGMYLTLPTGHWSVVEACSGVRYLIASFTLGLVYAYIAYQSLKRRLLFVLAAIVVPIIANSLRAWGVVMLGHYSGMTLGAGVDHLVYGWLFFGVVILLMFWVGSFWQQSESEHPADLPPAAAPVRFRPAGLVLALLLLLSVLPGPLAAYWLTQAEVRDAPQLSAPVAASGWQAVPARDWRWRPAQHGADRYRSVYYQGTGLVRLDIHQYLNQQPGMELVTSGQFWRGDRKTWRVLAEEQLRNRVDVPVDEAVLASRAGDEQLLIWSWYWVAGHATRNPYVVKLLEAQQLLGQGHREGARLYLSTPLQDPAAQSREVLENFLAQHWPAIKRSLEQQ